MKSIDAAAAKPGRRKRPSWLAGVFVLLLTAVAVVLFFHKIPLKAIEQAWGKLSWPVLLLALVCQLAFLEFRTMRFGSLAGPTEHAEKPWGARRWRWFGPTAAYSMTCSVFPGGIGELFLPVYLKPYGVASSASLGMAVASRLFDVGWSVILAFLFAIWIIPHQGWASVKLSLIAGALVMVGLILAVRLVNGRKMLEAAKRRHAPGWLQRAGGTAVRMQEVMTRLSWRDVLRLSWMTVAMKISSTAFYFVIAHGLGYSISFLHLAAAMMFFSLFMIFPLQGIGGFGSAEAWWILALTLIGTPIKESIVLALAFQVLNLLYVSVIGGGYVATHFRSLSFPGKSKNAGNGDIGQALRAK